MHSHPERGLLSSFSFSFATPLLLAVGGNPAAVLSQDLLDLALILPHRQVKPVGKTLK